MRLLTRRGQSVVEYAIVTVVAAASLALFFQLVRSATAHRMKDGADTFGHGLIYQP